MASERGAPAQGSPASNANAPSKVPAKTMLGMMSPFAPTAEVNAPAGAPEARPSAQAAPPAKSPHKQTMLGMAPAALQQGAPAPSVVKAEPGAAPGKLLTKDPTAVAPAGQAPVGNRTMLGMAPVAAALPGSEAPAQKPSPQSKHTILGAAPPPAAEKPALSPQSKRTMLGAAPPSGFALDAGAPAQAAASAPAAEGASEGRPRAFTPVPDDYSYSDDTYAGVVRTAKGRGPLVVAGILLALALAALAAVISMRGPKLSVRVVRADTGDALEVEVPGSAPGTKVRFGGAELPLNAGRAAFPLSTDALVLGENALAIDVIDPKGSVSSAEVKLGVDYRVRIDVSALTANPPAVELIVDALPGSKVTVDGEPLALDARGRAIKAYPIPPQAGTRFELSLKYRVELPEGPPVDGVATLSLPVTSMQIDRPGADVVTDQALVELAGVVEAGAEVLVEGRPIELRDGRFLHKAQLPEPGDYVLHVTARAPNKAPAVAELRLRRVTDMTLAAASFKADPSITYAKLMQNPVTYRGQKVSFDGRVYNVEVQGGRSILQLLVLDCPSSTRCPLWVEYGQATEATVDSRVRVLGTVVGEQQFRSKQGAVQTVPSVQAQYVLKLAR